MGEDLRSLHRVGVDCDDTGARGTGLLRSRPRATNNFWNGHGLRSHQQLSLLIPRAVIGMRHREAPEQLTGGPADLQHTIAEELVHENQLAIWR